MVELLIAGGCIVLFLAGSAMVSSSEVAYFSLSSSDIHFLKEKAAKDKNAQRIIQLISKPRYLLSTILILNNLFNVALVITSYFIVSSFIDFALHPVYAFIINVIGVTFLLVLIGEVMPKIYAAQNNLKIAQRMSMPLLIMNYILKPLNSILVSSTKLIEDRLSQFKQSKVTMEELEQVIDLTADPKTSKEEIRILKGIVGFGNITVKQIMRSRLDVIAIEVDTRFSELMNITKNAGYSRIPVYKENLDNIVGVLYVKDLLSHLSEPDDYKWQSLIRQPLFVPENKKIDDLLTEIKSNHIHLAIVVDEYGGTSGIITLEDILEEIIGDIQDEFDESEKLLVKKNDQNNYIFEGKVLIHDACKLMGIQTNTFDEVKGEADTLAGLLLEIARKIPAVNEEVMYKNYRFTVLSLGKHRIERLKITILPEQKEK